MNGLLFAPNFLQKLGYQVAFDPIVEVSHVENATFRPGGFALFLDVVVVISHDRGNSVLI